MNKWIKYNYVDQYITAGDEVDYATPGWKGSVAEFLKDWGVAAMLPHDEGWEVWVYEQGRGKFCWKNGEKKFCYLEWDAADALLEGYEAAKAVYEKRLEEEMAVHFAAVAAAKEE